MRGRNRNRHDVEQTLQGTLTFGGRGMDSIESVVHYPGKDKYALFIDTKHGERTVAELRMDDHTLTASGDSRVPPFLKLELSKNAANNLRREIESAFDVETREL